MQRTSRPPIRRMSYTTKLWLVVLFLVFTLVLAALLLRDEGLTGPNFAFGVVVGTVGVGGIVLVFAILQYRKSYARECFLQLHSDLLKIMDMKEAWVLDGKDWQHAVLLPENVGNIPTATATELNAERIPWHLHLRQVELRAILDDAWWTPRVDEYGLIQNLYFDLHASGTRRWILREKLLFLPVPDSNGSPVADAYKSGHGVHPRSRPALISSVGVEWLRAWIERFTEFGDEHSMTSEQKDWFDRWLMNMSAKDRRAWWGDKILSPRAMEYLQEFDEGRGKAYRLWLAGKGPKPR